MGRLNYIRSARREAQQALIGARSDASYQGAAQIFPGRIFEVIGGGLYRVHELGENGNVTATHEQVVAHPWAADLAEGDDVWLVRHESWALPMIIRTGSGGTTTIDQGMVTE